MAELPSQAWLSITKESRNIIVNYFEKTDSASPKYKVYFPFNSKPEDTALANARAYAKRIADAHQSVLEDLL